MTSIDFPRPEHIVEREVFVDERNRICGVAWVDDAGNLGYLPVDALDSVSDEAFELIDSWIVEASDHQDLLPMLPIVEESPGTLCSNPVREFTAPIIRKCHDEEARVINEFRSKHGSAILTRKEVYSYRTPGTPVSQLREDVEGVWIEGLGELFSRIYKAMAYVINRYISLDSKVVDTVIVWAMASYFRDMFRLFPALMIDGAPGCGKTTLLKVLNQLCYTPMLNTIYTPSALRRMAGMKDTTQLLDELGSASKMDKEDGVMNFIRCSVDRNSRFTMGDKDSKDGVISFNVYASTAYVAKGVPMPEDIVQRSLLINMVKIPGVSSNIDYLDEDIWLDEMGTPRAIRGMLTSIRMAHTAESIKFDDLDLQLDDPSSRAGLPLWRGLLDGAYLRRRVYDLYASVPGPNDSISYHYVEVYPGFEPCDISGRALDVATPVTLFADLCNCEPSVITSLISSISSAEVSKKNSSAYIVAHALFTLLYQKWAGMTMAGVRTLASDRDACLLLSHVTTREIKDQIEIEREPGEISLFTARTVATNLNQLGFRLRRGAQNASKISEEGALASLQSTWIEFASLDTELPIWAEFQKASSIPGFKEPAYQPGEEDALLRLGDMWVSDERYKELTGSEDREVFDYDGEQYEIND